MKTSISHFKNRLVVLKASVATRAAFTVVELLVVLATITVFAAMLLPALAGTQVQSKVTACEARFRQWAASANLYADDNRDWLPTGNNLLGGGMYAWDVGTNMVNALYPYGMDVPVWFCPMRPAERDAANSWGQAHLGLPIQNISQLRQYFSRNYPVELILNDNYWVPRSTGGNTFPIDYSNRSQALWPAWLRSEPTPTFAIYGWPQRLHDIAAAHVPFVSDTAASGFGSGLLSPVVGPSAGYISPNTAHFVNRTLIGVNLAFADGHVTSHTPDQMRCVYQVQGAAIYWFY